jgi:hypothetical protein
VRITGVDVLRWYKLPIGNEYDVKYLGENCYVTVDDRYVIDQQDCTEVEPQPQQAWEKYPTFESCRGNDGYVIGVSTSGIHKTDAYIYVYPTKALAKYARAVMILSTVAKKWNEGVEIESVRVWFPTKYKGKIIIDSWVKDGDVYSLLPFYFHTSESLQKSIELFPNEWKDFFNAKN